MQQRIFLAADRLGRGPAIELLAPVRPIGDLAVGPGQRDRRDVERQRDFVEFLLLAPETIGRQPEQETEDRDIAEYRQQLGLGQRDRPAAGAPARGEGGHDRQGDDERQDQPVERAARLARGEQHGPAGIGPPQQEGGGQRDGDQAPRQRGDEHAQDGGLAAGADEQQ